MLRRHDTSLRQLKAKDRAAWRQKVAAQLRQRWPGAEFLLLAPGTYRAVVSELPHAWPLEGMTTHAAVQWLRRELSDRAPVASQSL